MDFSHESNSYYLRSDLSWSCRSITFGTLTYPYYVAPDGKRFLVLVLAGEVEAPAITVAMGWA